MKNIFYLLLLVCTSNAFSQSNIANDDTFLKYEKSYNDYVNSFSKEDLKNLDHLEKVFYGSFKNLKAKKSFLNAKDKRKWLEKNISKTTFYNLPDALSSFDSIQILRNSQIEKSVLFTTYLNELLKKYDGDLIWQTLKSRLIIK